MSEERSPITSLPAEQLVALGITSFFAGLVGVGFVYSRRPPADGFAALGMLLQGRTQFIQHGWFEFLMVAALVLAGGGLYVAVKNYSRLRQATGR